MRRLLRIATGIVGRGPREGDLRRAVAGQVVLVTGASEGIGAAIARRPAPRTRGQPARRRGDVGYLDSEGRLMLQGLRDSLLISGGVNVYPEPVAAALAEHPDIAEVATVRLRRGATLSEDGLRAWQRLALPPPQRPRDFTVVEDLDDADEVDRAVH